METFVKPRNFLTLIGFEELCRNDDNLNDSYSQLRDIVAQCKHEYFDIFLPRQQSMLQRFHEEKLGLSNAISSLHHHQQRGLRELYKCVKRLYEQLDDVIAQIDKVNADADQQTSDIFKEFHKALEKLESLLPDGFRLPCEITLYSIRTDADEANNTVTFECGDVIDSNGKSVFSISCYLCKRMIQNGTTGVYQPRWSACDSDAYFCYQCHNLKQYCIRLIKEVVKQRNVDVDDSFNLNYIAYKAASQRHRFSCHDIVVENEVITVKLVNDDNSTSTNQVEIPTVISPWRGLNSRTVDEVITNEAVDEELLDILEELDPFWYECFFVEFNHPIWLRDYPRDSVQKLTLGIIENYQYRPLICEPFRLFSKYFNPVEGQKSSLLRSDRESCDKFPTTWISLDWICKRLGSVQNHILSLNPQDELFDQSFIFVMGRPSFEWCLVDMLAAVCEIRIAAGHCNWTTSDICDALQVLLGPTSRIGSKTSKVYFFCEDTYCSKILEALHISNLFSLSEDCQSQKDLIKPYVFVWSRARDLASFKFHPSHFDTCAVDSDMWTKTFESLHMRSLDDIFLEFQVDDKFFESPLSVRDVGCFHLIMYTSGSTGKPKAAKISSQAWIQMITKTPSFFKPLCVILHSPLYLMGERLGLWATLCNGGRFGIISSTGDLEDGHHIIRPTMYTAPPKLWLHYFSRLRQLDRSSVEYAQEIDRVRERFGGRISFAGTGGAPSGQQVLQMMEDCFGNWDNDEQKAGNCDGQIGHNYGCTEAGNIAMNGIIEDGVQVYIESVPDFALLEEEGRCFMPKRIADSTNVNAGGEPVIGQICVKTKTMFSGYLGVENDVIFTDDGYYRTGDLGYLLPNRRIIVVGRCKTAVKMVDGTFFNPESMESDIMNIIDKPGGFVIDDRALFIGSVVVGVVPQSSSLWNSEDMHYGSEQSGHASNDCIFGVLFLDGSSVVQSDNVSLSHHVLDANSKAFQQIVHKLSRSHRPSLIFIEQAINAPSLENGLSTSSGKISRAVFGGKYDPIAVSAIKLSKSSRDLTQLVELSDAYQVLLQHLERFVPSSIAGLQTKDLTLSGGKTSAREILQSYIQENVSVTLPQLGFDSLSISSLSSECALFLSQRSSNSVTKSQLFSAFMSQPLKVVVDNMLNKGHANAQRQEQPRVAYNSLELCEQDVHDYRQMINQEWKVLMEEISDQDFEITSNQEINDCHKGLLLTGATGYVGCNFLIRWLASKMNLIKMAVSASIDLSPTHYDIIFCLVRVQLHHNSNVVDYSVEEMAIKRLISCVKLHVSNKELDCSKLIHTAIDQGLLKVVAGDISVDNFDLSFSQLSELHHKVKCMIHAAAEVKMFTNYETLRPTNVIGTVQCLRFYLQCLKNALKSKQNACLPTLLHISTISVIPSTASSESFSLPDSSPYLSELRGGYEQSKCVAEILCQHVVNLMKDCVVVPVLRDQGLIHVMRLGFVGWAKRKSLFDNSFLTFGSTIADADASHTTSYHSIVLGQGNRADWFCRLLEGCHFEKCAPSFDTQVTSSIRLSILPIEEMVDLLNYLVSEESDSFRRVSCLSYGLGAVGFNVPAMLREVASDGLSLGVSSWCDHACRSVDSKDEHPLLPIIPMIQSSRKNFLLDLISGHALATALLANDPLRVYVEKHGRDTLKKCQDDEDGRNYVQNCFVHA